MDVDPLGSHPPLPTRSNLSPCYPPRKDLSTRYQKTPPNLRTRGDTPRRSPLNVKKGATQTGRSNAHTAPNAPGIRPLVPISERRPAGQDGKKVKDVTHSDGGNIAPDGGSAGREGRHFTVANVGSNGQIFLRPTIRPANQRYPQPQFIFPTTPPSTAGLDPTAHGSAEDEDVGELHGSQWTDALPQDPSSPSMARKKAHLDLKSSTVHQRRAMSDSTILEASIAREGDAGAFKVVISKPQDHSKSKTTEDVNQAGIPLLDISIPSWKLGTPRFTMLGTPLIRGSSYAPTEDLRSSNVSCFRSSPRGQNSFHPGNVNADNAVTLSRNTHHISRGLLSPLLLPSPRVHLPLRAKFVSTHLIIDPAMFDMFTFPPGCDDRLIVRYSSTTKAITAATPPRLVAEITSPCFLDYELISDFFLTFRSFLETSALLRMLVARLRWALQRADEAGMVVRVRTFVAIRHWVLNYFVDDFVVDYDLRVTFCHLLNDFMDELFADQPGQKVQLKILGELKKCWRRVCAQYWDGPDFDSSLGPESPIAPGGIAGHRNPNLDPSFWEAEMEDPPQLYGADLLNTDSNTESSFYADVSKAGHIDSILLSGVRPVTPEAHPSQPERQQTSPISIESIDVISCSFPTKAPRAGDQSASQLVGAHPVDPSSVYMNADPVASTPRALTGKRVRPQTSHKRNNSLTGSLRDHGTTTERVLYKNAELLLTLPYAGSLVRGNLLPPGQAFVELGSPDQVGGSRQTTVFQPQPVSDSSGKGSASAMSGQGMKKLIGSVRRALRTRGQDISPTQVSLLGIAPLGPRGATTNRLPGTAIVPQVRRPRPSGIKPPLRVDLLGAKVAEDFKRAVREDAAAEARSDKSVDVATDKSAIVDVEYSAAHLDSSFELRPVSGANMTEGSKSIVIVDGTLALDNQTFTTVLPAFNPSMEAFAESVVPSRAGNPTPPMTPPGQALRGNTPRRSSYILGQHAVDHLPTDNPLLRTVDQTTVTESDDRPGMHDPPISRCSDEVATQPLNKPPLSYLRLHKRQQSSRSFRSKSSVGLRRYASFQSGAAGRSTVRSFDATTCSGASMRSEVMPAPLRVLRRKPGGDLRGATNVADLDPHPLRRSHSLGSLTTYSDSLRSSYILSRGGVESSGFVDVVSSDFSHNRPEIFSLGAMADPALKHPLSFFSTHSSKAILRPSFEAEAQKLAQIPDDIDDDGGVESALLKLEGKYERKAAKLSMNPVRLPVEDIRSLGDEKPSTPEVTLVKEEKRKHRHQRIGEDEVPAISPVEDDAQTQRRWQLQPPRHSEVSSFFSEGSRESYNSTPLLDRGLADGDRSKTNTQEWTDRSILEGPDTPVDELDRAAATSSLPQSYEFVTKTDSINQAEVRPSEQETNDDPSFLHMDSDVNSELSSEMSGEIVEAGDYFPNQPFAPTDPVYNLEPSVDDGAGRVLGNDESPISLAQALKMSPQVFRVPEVEDHELWFQKPLPPTPDTTPTAATYNQRLHSALDAPNTNDALRNAPPDTDVDNRKPSIHLPFILAFDSEILAQQFTLIEKDALNEVDWKELIDMKWKNSNHDSRSWVDFLRKSDAHGVEVVIARFNIMVKWAISEIVLSQDLEERAQCIIKYLHIAAHCRRYRNYATASQIAIALTSNEVARLCRTWTLVPSGDMQTMSELETLVSPTKNFYNLRVEMESSVAPDSGCIPFVGIYTHDLLFNSQRPSEIASSPSTAPLVNFERCRIAASVVKTLLRLLEASSYYQFQPIEGITERCLWMSALSDEEIRKHSERLE